MGRPGAYKKNNKFQRLGLPTHLVRYFNYEQGNSMATADLSKSEEQKFVQLIAIKY